MKHISDAQKAARLSKVTVGNVAKTADAVSFAIKIPQALPFETITPDSSKKELSQLLGVDAGVAVTQGENVYRVVLTGAAKAAFDQIEAAGKEQATATAVAR